MDELIQSLSRALSLIVSGDAGLWEFVSTSLFVSLQAILYTAPVALLLAFALTHLHFPGRRLLLSTFQALMAAPALMVGLVLYLLLSRAGPLGDLQLMFTMPAMIMGQMLLAFPIVVALAYAAFAATDRAAWETARTLGAGGPRAVMTTMNEARLGLYAALIAAFGRVLGEVGCALVVGGNILHHTRSVPGAIFVEYNRGAAVEGIALGAVLLALALLLIIGVNSVQSRVAGA